MLEPVSTRGTFFHGRKSSIGPTPAAITDVESRPQFGILIKAAEFNTDIIWIGSSADLTMDSKDETDGFPLLAGQSVTIEINDPRKIYSASESENQTAFWIGT